MPITIPATMKSLVKNSAAQLFQAGFFEVRYSTAVDRYFKVVRPVLGFPGREVALGFNVGTRANGRDAARWPEDLSVEVIA